MTRVTRKLLRHMDALQRAFPSIACLLRTEVAGETFDPHDMYCAGANFAGRSIISHANAPLLSAERPGRGVET